MPTQSLRRVSNELLLRADDMPLPEVCCAKGRGREYDGGEMVLRLESAEAIDTALL